MSILSTNKSMFIFLHWGLESLSILSLNVAVNLRAIYITIGMMKIQDGRH